MLTVKSVQSINLRSLAVCYLKFPKVVLVHILGEVETFYTVLLRVYPSTSVPIFIEIGL